MTPAPHSVPLGDVETEFTELVERHEKLLPLGLRAYASIIMVEADIARLAPSLLTALAALRGGK